MKASTGSLLTHVGTALLRQSDQVLKERLGIGVAQYKILQTLEAHAQLQQRALADYLGQTEASISRQVKLLDEKGLITTRVNPQNRREHLTALTPKGIKLTQAAEEVMKMYQESVIAKLGDKTAQRFAEILGLLHIEVCRSGKQYSCDHPFDVSR